MLTSQRIVDVVLKAFNACAASQGCCKWVVSAFSNGKLGKLISLFVRSNLTFGQGGKDKDGVVTSGWGYYEVRSVHLVQGQSNLDLNA